jgi:hypothetical protein
MKILMAYSNKYENDNPFVSTLVSSLQELGCDMDWDIEPFWKTDNFNYDIVHVQWPESLFNWRVPSYIEFEFLKQRFKQIKKYTKVVYTRHNSNSHSANPVFHELYQLVEENSDLVVHLGNCSKREFLHLHPNLNCSHAVIPHHLYDTFYIKPFPDKRQARQALNIDQSKTVILCFGAFRHDEEREFILQSFKKTDIKNKLLFAPRWYNKRPRRPSLRKPIQILKFYFDFVKSGLSNTLFRWSFVAHEDIPNYFVASDIVLIQRLDTLNTGNVTLAMLFSRPIVGPAAGNTKEQLEYLQQPVFNSNDINSCAQALEYAHKHSYSIDMESFYAKAKDEWGTNSIAQQYLNAYHSLIK